MYTAAEKEILRYAVMRLDPIDVKKLLENCGMEVTIKGGLDGSPPEPQNPEEVEFTFDITKFRTMLIALLQFA